jgi:hypothetical protein
MKHVQTLVLAALWGFALTLGAGAVAQNIQPGVLTVVRIAGEARYSLGDGVWHPLVAGKVLAAGSVIQAGHDATVDIVLGKKILTSLGAATPQQIEPAIDSPVRGFISYTPTVEQNVIRLTSDTVLAIDKLNVSDTGVDTVSDTELDLRQGRIYCSVKKLSGASQYLIKIPNGIAGVRGTWFMIDANGYVGVLRNSVVLSIIGADGKPITVVVGEGNQFDPKSGLITPLGSFLPQVLDPNITSLRTITLPKESILQPDNTLCRISPTSGHRGGGHHSGWWSWW